MSLLAPKDADTLTDQAVLEKLTYWAAHLTEAKRPNNSVVTLTEARDQCDKWLDELLVRMRGR